MGGMRTGRARRVTPTVPGEAWEGRAPDFGSSFAGDCLGADDRSAEQWARTILEGAPLILRWAVLFGWRLILRLRLAPGGPDSVAGWRIRAATPDAITLEVESGSILARKILSVDHDGLVLTTHVWFRSRTGRVLWSTLVPVHHLLEPVLVTLAVSRRRRP